MKKIIETSEAPAAIGTYSQAVQVGNLVYLSGQIPLDPKTQQIVSGDIQAQIEQVFANILAIARAAGGDLSHVVKLTIYIRDFSHFPVINQIMTHLFTAPYPARAVIGVASLPKDAQVEIDAILCLSNFSS